jgi:hypothetical protein
MHRRVAMWHALLPWRCATPVALRRPVVYHTQVRYFRPRLRACMMHRCVACSATLQVCRLAAMRWLGCLSGPTRT